MCERSTATRRSRSPARATSSSRTAAVVGRATARQTSAASPASSSSCAKALSKAFAIGITDLGTFTRLLNVAKDSVTIDQTIDRGDLFNLVQRFKELQPSDIESYALPVTNHTTAGGASVLLLDQVAAQPALDVFRGLDPTEVTESQVSVQVLNGSGAAGQARDVRTALTAVGFSVGAAGNGPASAQTVIQYAPGSETAADLLSRHLSSPSVLVVDPTLGANHLALVTGTDFTTVMQTPRPPDETTTTTTLSPGSTPADSVPVNSTTSTTLVGITPGEAPPGVNC